MKIERHLGFKYVFQGVNQERSSWNCDRLIGRYVDELRRKTEAGVQTFAVEIGASSNYPPSRKAAEAKYLGVSDYVTQDYDQAYSDCDVISDAANMPFRSSSIDIVRSNSVYEHLKCPASVSRECHRILKPGGLFIVTVPFHFIEHGWPFDYFRYTPDGMSSVLAEAGFSSIEIEKEPCAGFFYTLHNLSKGSACKGIFPSLYLRFVQVMLYFGSFLDENATNSSAYYHSIRGVAVRPLENTTFLNNCEPGQAKADNEENGIGDDEVRIVSSSTAPNLARVIDWTRVGQSGNGEFQIKNGQFLGTCRL